MIHRVKRFKKIKQRQSNKKSLVKQPLNVVGNMKKCGDSAVKNQTGKDLAPKPIQCIPQSDPALQF
jgi:hypothetical protein